jgi:hypothetical protein
LMMTWNQNRLIGEKRNKQQHNILRTRHCNKMSLVNLSKRKIDCYSCLNSHTHTLTKKFEEWKKQIF